MLTGGYDMPSSLGSAYDASQSYSCTHNGMTETCTGTSNSSLGTGTLTMTNEYNDWGAATSQTYDDGISTTMSTTWTYDCSGWPTALSSKRCKTLTSSNTSAVSIGAASYPSSSTNNCTWTGNQQSCTGSSTTAVGTNATATGSTYNDYGYPTSITNAAGTTTTSYSCN